MSDYQSIKSRRAETDYIMPMWLAFLPIIIGIVGGIVAAILVAIAFLFVSAPQPVSTVTTGFINSTNITVSQSAFPALSFTSFLSILSILIPVEIIGIIADAVWGYVIYRLIKRFNDHAARMKALFGSVNQDGRENQVINEIDSLPKRDPAMWAILIAVLSIIPYVSIASLILLLYIFHSLNKDFVKLESIENNGFMQIGWRGERHFKMVDRSTALYIVLTIITLGIFMLYWIYTIAKDPNEHFREDWRIEDSITPGS